MNQIQNNVITKEAIVDYVDNMEIKKSNIGGYDKVDVYVHIQELLKMYGAYSEQELGRQKETLEEQKKEIEMLKSARKELASRKTTDDEKEEEIKKQRERVADLMHYKDMVDSLQGENKAQSKRIEALKKVEELAQTLKRENEVLNQEIESMAAVSDKKARELSDGLNLYKDQAMRLQQKVDMLKEEREGLQRTGTFSESLQKELENRADEMLELKEELQKKTDEIRELRRENKEKQLEITQKEDFYDGIRRNLENTRKTEEERKDSPASVEMQKKLKEQEKMIMEKEQKIYSMMQEIEGKERELEAIKESDVSQGLESYSYTQEIGEILREARREGQNIIDNARIEAEQEMIKLLNLRAKYNQEMEVYQNWCKRVEMEKKSIEEFFKQLSDQYENADRALSSVREKASSFDIKRFFKSISSQQSNVEEAENEEKGLG